MERAYARPLAPFTSPRTLYETPAKQRAWFHHGYGRSNYATTYLKACGAVKPATRSNSYQQGSAKLETSSNGNAIVALANVSGVYARRNVLTIVAWIVARRLRTTENRAARTARKPVTRNLRTIERHKNAKMNQSKSMAPTATFIRTRWMCRRTPSDVQNAKR